jgi:hypothetical protein
MSLSIILLFWLIKGSWSWHRLSLVPLAQSLPWIAYPCCFGTITFLAYTWPCRTSKAPVAILASFPMAPSFLVSAAKSRVCSDWLTSSSKLQPYLELCWFIQALLKTRVARWKVHFLIGLAKVPCATFVRTDGVLLKVRNQKRECSAWSLVATTSHILAL